MHQHLPHACRFPLPDIYDASKVYATVAASHTRALAALASSSSARAASGGAGTTGGARAGSAGAAGDDGGGAGGVTGGLDDFDADGEAYACFLCSRARAGIIAQRLCLPVRFVPASAGGYDSDNSYDSDAPDLEHHRPHGDSHSASAGAAAAAALAAAGKA